MEDHLELEIQSRLLLVEEQSAAESDSDDEFHTYGLARKVQLLDKHGTGRAAARHGLRATLATLGKGEQLISQATGVIFQEHIPEWVRLAEA